MDGKYHKLLKEREIQRSKKTERTNPIAMALNVTACLIFIAGLIAGLTRFSDDGLIESLMLYCAIGFVPAILFAGLAEVIQLLQDIKDK